MTLTTMDQVILIAVVLLLLAVIYEWNRPEVDDPMRGYHVRVMGVDDFYIVYQSANQYRISGTCFARVEVGDFLRIDQQAMGQTVTLKVTHLTKYDKDNYTLHCEKAQ